METEQVLQRNSSIENAMRILKTFSMHQPELRVVDIAGELNIAKSTAHRLLSTLASEGFVYKDPQSNHYSLGVSVLALTNIVNSQLPIVKEATPILNALTEKTGESSHLAIREGHEVIYLQKIENEYSVHVTTHIGRRNPVHCTSTGQAILAFETDEVVDEILSGPLVKFTEHTITEPQQLRDKLKEVRRLGYVIDHQGFENNVISIGAPIFNSQDEVMASVNITGPVNRLKAMEAQRKCVEEVVTTARRVSNLVKLRKKLFEEERGR
ncbi:IclR family transcriptional regulator [Sporosarcina sp. 179-K 3D1 HS]|uniref:IclR family transcriptional regulator n=1 Tax=Sporosarcina sp. 179-K 3D1 HS TaxID=3232169 RepID=UPI0039A21AA9